uniref:ABC transporter substrate-binding protein n=1 Tax=Streptomyces sp. SBT349 TaxID=1580539 RepID=UPI00066E4C72
GAGGGEHNGSGLPRYAIGLHADLSGPSAAQGRAQENGLRLAVEEFNAAPDRPCDLAVVTEDDAGDPVAATAAADRLAADASVIAVVGPTTDAAGEAAVPRYDEVLLPLLALSVGSFATVLGTHPALLHARPPTFFVGLSLAVSVVERTGATTLGFVDDRTGDMDSAQMVRAAMQAADSLAVATVPRVVSAGTEDFGPVIGELAAEGAQAVVYGGPAGGAAHLATGLAAAGFAGTAIGGPAVLDPAFLAAAGEAAEGWLVVAPYIDPAATAETREFADLYRGRFDADPPYGAAEAYDAAWLLAGAVTALGDGGEVAREALGARLRESTHDGVGKALAFDPQDGGFLVSDENTGVYLYRVEGGAFRYLGAAPLPPLG